MSEAKNKEAEDKKAEDKKSDSKKTLRLGGTLSLKGGAAPSGPRSSGPGTVAVEVRRKRATPSTPEKTESKTSDDARLTSDEREARAEALKKAQADGGKSKSSLPKRRVTIEDKKKEEAASKEEAQQTAREKELEEMKKIDEEEGAKAAEVQKNAPPMPDTDSPAARRKFGDDKETESYRDKIKKAAPKTPPKTVGERSGGRITVTQAINSDYDRDRGPSMAAQRRAREKARMAAKGPQEPAQKVFREVIVPETITVAELANRMTEPTGDVVKKLMGLGVMATVTQTIDADTAELVIEEKTIE